MMEMRSGVAGVRDRGNPRKLQACAGAQGQYAPPARSTSLSTVLGTGKLQWPSSRMVSTLAELRIFVWPNSGTGPPRICDQLPLARVPLLLV